MSYKTPLFEKHVSAGARMVDFNRWELPLYYSGIIDEHRAVRGSAAVFDLCHMARFKISGEEAENKLSQNTTGDIFSVKPGRAKYMLACDDSGGIVDDMLVYRARDYFLVVANAGNREAVFGLLKGEGAADLTFEKGMLAVQGPAAAEITMEIFGEPAGSLKNYGFGFFDFKGSEIIASRTGYTGEDGFEFFVDAGSAPDLWDVLTEAGAGRGVLPAGLGARDILRLEAGMPLYGHELDLSVDPFEAGLGRFVSFEKSFTGCSALAKYKTREPERILSGIISLGKAVPRQGCPLYAGGARAGTLTSGSYSPSLEKSVGMGYIKREFSVPGTELEVEIRKRRVPARVVDLPFYRKERKHGNA